MAINLPTACRRALQCDGSHVCDRAVSLDSNSPDTVCLHNISQYLPAFCCGAGHGILVALQLGRQHRGLIASVARIKRGCWLGTSLPPAADQLRHTCSRAFL